MKHPLDINYNYNLYNYNLCLVDVSLRINYLLTNSVLRWWVHLLGNRLTIISYSKRQILKTKIKDPIYRYILIDN